VTRIDGSALATETNGIYGVWALECIKNKQTDIVKVQMVTFITQKRKQARLILLVDSWWDNIYRQYILILGYFYLYVSIELCLLHRKGNAFKKRSV
jgi:hypothetical protein